MGSFARLRGLIRDAYKNASAPVHMKTQAYVMNADLPDKVKIPAMRGDQTLIGVLFKVTLAVSGGTVTAVANTGLTTKLLSQIEIKGDGQALVESNSAEALRELLNVIWDKEPSDAVLTSAGTASSIVIVPVSGRGRKTITVNVKFPTFATMYSAGTEGAKVLSVSAIYGSVALPSFVLFTNGQAISGTGRRSIDQQGPQDEIGYPSYALVLGDGTLVIDDVEYLSADGRQYFDDKFDVIKANEQMHLNITLESTGLVYGEMDSLIPVSARDRFDIDVTTAGSFFFGGLYAIDTMVLEPESQAGKQGSPNQNSPEDEIDILPKDQFVNARSGSGSRGGNPLSKLRENVRSATSKFAI
jgi:hypothetical protein